MICISFGGLALMDLSSLPGSFICPGLIGLCQGRRVCSLRLTVARADWSLRCLGRPLPSQLVTSTSL
jgi:hypothetical protein